MIEINLLPQSEKSKIIAQRMSAFFTSLVVPVSLLIILVTAVLFGLVQYLNIKNSQLDNQITEANSQVDKYNDVKKTIDNFNTILSSVDKLSQYWIDWPAILIDLAHQVPPDLQITKFNFDTKNLTQIKITGLAANYRSIILFREKLNSSEQFKNANLNMAAYDTTLANTINFELSVELPKAKISVPSSTKTQGSSQQQQQQQSSQPQNRSSVQEEQ